MPADDKIRTFGARETNADVELPLARFGGEENSPNSTNNPLCSVKNVKSDSIPSLTPHQMTDDAR